jgi:DNA-binding CsgD family transcriptional regulator
MARAERDPLVRFPAYATDGILAAGARSQGAARQLERAASLFETDVDAAAGSRMDPLWVELMGHVCMAQGQERRVRTMVNAGLAAGSFGAAERQRLECLLAMAELDSGHLILAAAALTEAALPTGMVDPDRSRWARTTLDQLPAWQPDRPGLSADELRVLAAVEEGLTDPQAAQRLGLSTRSVRFYRGIVREKLTARHRSA